MTTQNFPNCPDPNASPFAWALRNDAETVAEEISRYFASEASVDEWDYQLAALLALAED